MRQHGIFAAVMGLAIGVAATAFGQSGAVGTAPGVPQTERQSVITEPENANSERGSRSEREARDDFGAQRATGDQLGPPAGVVPSENQLRRMLEKQGYSDVRNLAQQGDKFTARATKDNRDVQISIDPHQGKIEEIGG